MFSYFKRHKTPKTIEQKLDVMLKQQGEMAELMQAQHDNILVLYRRTTALAHMLDVLAKHGDVMMPKTIRAEVDASLHPDEFVTLAQADEAEFTSRYGETTLKVLQKHGMNAISTVGDLCDSVRSRTLQ